MYSNLLPPGWFIVLVLVMALVGAGWLGWTGIAFIAAHLTWVN